MKIGWIPPASVGVVLLAGLIIQPLDLTYVKNHLFFNPNLPINHVTPTPAESSPAAVPNFNAVEGKVLSKGKVDGQEAKVLVLTPKANVYLRENTYIRDDKMQPLKYEDIKNGAMVRVFGNLVEDGVEATEVYLVP